MKDQFTTIKYLKEKVAKFVVVRDWEKYHSPKNLAMSIAIEAAELMEHFQWLTIEESRKVLKNKTKRKKIEEEIADIILYILDFSNRYNINLSKAVLKKLQKAVKKYPAPLIKKRS